MDNKTKCIIGILVLFIILALIFFWPFTPSAKSAYLTYDAHEADADGNNGYIKITCYENDTDGGIDKKLENVTVLVNVTYTNKTVKTYNLTTDSNGEAKIHNLKSGTYTVSAWIAGEDGHNSSVLKEKVKIKKDTTTKNTETRTDTEYKTETEYDTEYETEYDTRYDTEYDTEYETYYEEGEPQYTYTYYWVYV